VYALDVLHDDVRHLILIAEVVYGDDVRMLQPAGGSRFHVQPVLEAFVVRHVGADQDRLDRHDAVDDRIARLVNHAHAAAAERGQDFVLADLLRLLLRRHGYLCFAAARSASTARGNSTSFSSWMCWCRSESNSWSRLKNCRTRSDAFAGGVKLSLAS